jgi:hypothetical protein
MLPRKPVTLLKQKAKGWNWLDATFVGFIALLGLGFWLVQSGQHVTSSQKIEGEADVFYTVWTHNTATLQPKLFTIGEQTNLTIRNQPRGKVSIVSVKQESKKLIIPQAQGFKLIEDPTSTAPSYDFYITLKDHALKTPDGYVSNGIKLKIGLPIEVEGFNYRLTGVLINIEPATAATTTLLKEEAVTGKTPPKATSPAQAPAKATKG